MLFSVQFSCKLSAHNSAYILKVISSPTPNAICPIHQTFVGFMHGSTVFLGGFVCRFLCFTIAAFLFARFLYCNSLFVFFGCNLYSFFGSMSSTLLAHLNTCSLNISLVFHRKDLCDARAKPKMSSKFQMRCTPPVEVSGGQEQYYIRSS